MEAFPNRAELFHQRLFAFQSARLIKAHSDESHPRLDILKWWQEQGWATVKTEVRPETYEQAAMSFMRFISEVPDEQKEKIKAFFEGETSALPGLIGYAEQKPARPEDGTHRIVFHYHPQVESLFAAEIEAAGGPTKEFLQQARAIWDSTLTLAQAVVRDLENDYPGIYDAFFPPGVEPGLVLRFILYKKQPHGAVLQKGHHDRDAITLALAESGPGLRIGKDAKSLKPIQRKKGEAVVMAGVGMRKFDENLSLTWHDVVQDTDDERWSLIAQLFVGGLRLMPR